MVVRPRRVQKSPKNRGLKSPTFQKLHFENIKLFSALSNRNSVSDTENAAPVTAGNGAALYDTFRSVSRLDYRTLLRLNAIALQTDLHDFADHPIIGLIVDLADPIEFEAGRVHGGWQS